MFYKSIHIEGFRGIKELTLNNLSQINLLVGKNNCGKTSVLEAIYLHLGSSLSTAALSVQYARNINQKNDDEFSSLFYNLDFKNKLSIAALLSNDQNLLLTIKPNYEKQTSVNQNFFTGVDQSKISGLDLEYSFLPIESNNLKLNGSISISSNNYIVIPVLSQKIKLAYLTDNSISNNLSEKIEMLMIDKKLNLIVNILKEIEPNLLDIKIGNDQKIYVDIGLSKLFPLNLLGEGFKRTLSIIATLYTLSGGILLIDEIENGLYYESLNVLWRGIYTAALAFNVQLFITTHSYECVETCLSTNKDYPDKELLNLLRIEKLGEENKAVSLNSDELDIMFEKRWAIW